MAPPRRRNPPRPRRKKRANKKTRLTDSKIYSFKRTCELKAFSGSTNFSDNAIYDNTGRYTGNFRFSLDDLPNYLDFANLFNQYKITGVKLKFIPVAGTESTVAAPGLSVPQLNPLAICITRGALNLAPTFSQMMQQQDVKVMSSNRPFTLWVSKPQAYAPADSITQAVMINPWIDAGVTQAVHHYGVQYCFESNTGSGTTTSVAYRVFATYYIKCKAPE